MEPAEKAHKKELRHKKADGEVGVSKPVSSTQLTRPPEKANIPRSIKKKGLQSSCDRGSRIQRGNKRKYRSLHEKYLFADSLRKKIFRQ